MMFGFFIQLLKLCVEISNFIYFPNALPLELVQAEQVSKHLKVF